MIRFRAISTFLQTLLLAALLCAYEIPVYAADPHQIAVQALIMARSGDYTGAISLLHQAMLSFPYQQSLRDDLATVHQMTGVHYLDGGRYQEAAEQFDLAGQHAPDEPRVHLLRGIALLGNKEYAAATVELDRARSLGGTTAAILFNLGRVQYELSNTAQAVELWEQALRLEPDNSTIVAQLEKAHRELQVETRMDRGEGGHFIVSHDSASDLDFADDVLDLLEEFYVRVGSDFSYYPEAKVPVILYTGRDYRAVTNSPDWSAGLYDGKIRLPIGGLTEVRPPIRAVLRHEYTHALIHSLAGVNCPTWLNEGLAEVQGRREASPALQELPRAVAAKRLLSFAELSGSFAHFQGSQVQLAYEQSHSMVNFMLQRYGWYSVTGLIRMLGTGKSLEVAVRSWFLCDVKDIESEWRTAVEREFAGN